MKDELREPDRTETSPDRSSSTIRFAHETGGTGCERKSYVVRAFLAVSVTLCALYLAACSEQPPANNNQAATSATPSSGKHQIAVLETTAGTIKFELLDDEAPKTAENFEDLAKRGSYNGTIFHRTIPGFMIQGGDPRGDGTGGQTATGAPLPNEVHRESPLYQGGYKRGLVAMANRGAPETGTSQFFIMHRNYPLPPSYTIFGRVTEGLDVVDKIATAPTTAGDRPINPVKMNKVYIQ
jgi:cyclophilin family peptidyl-prolyl cis-trans isomerase